MTGLFELDQNFYKPGDVAQPHVFRQRLVDLLGGRRGEAGDVPDTWTKKVTVAMQKVSEEIAVHMLDHLHNLTGCPNVVLGGGYFMNCVFNGKVTRLTDFKNVYIPHAPGDNGNSIGAALYLAHNVFGESRMPRYQTSFLGPSFGKEEIEQVLERRNIACRKLEDPARDIARLLSEEGVVAVCNGPMEFGERALGNRSILGDPREAATKDKINSAIKYREAYRPFAPAVPAARVHEYFEVEPGYRCPYMEKVVMVREEHRPNLGAITHVDGSARAQTVDPEENGPFHDIIEAFGEETGIPVVLNTSFNVAGEPIVHSPDDALSTFFNSGLTHLVLGHRYLVEKR
ncbi:MAG: carbamoyltransferase C-terminal domain-containing protein [Balneolaceae bacterium]|nr:carbamoyltransferase C-terminal domain-containing protein [Balneolaceae bacterium]